MSQRVLRARPQVSVGKVWSLRGEVAPRRCIRDAEGALGDDFRSLVRPGDTTVSSLFCSGFIMDVDRARVAMTIEEMVLERLRDLPPEKQKEVLDFVDFLKEKNGPKKARRSLLGLWSDLDIHITEGDIAEARREMWGNFPRDIA